MDITDQYLASAKIKRAEEHLRMAVDATGLGTFQITADDRTFSASPKLEEFFGFYPDEPMPYQSAINQIQPDFRQFVVNQVKRAFCEGTRFDIEHQIIGYHDGKISGYVPLVKFINEMVKIILQAFSTRLPRKTG